MARMAKSFLENDFIRFLYNLSGQGATYTILMRQLSSSDSYSGSSSGTSTVAQNVGGAAERAGAQTFIENVNISADSSTTMDEMANRVTFAKAMARARE